MKVVDEYKLRLPPDLFSCPVYWRNFVKSINIDGHSGDLVWIALMDYKVKYEHGLYTLITFESEEDFIFFKLKWS